MKKVETITIAELTEMAQNMYGSLVKGVIDIDRDRLVLDAEMHADEEQFLLQDGSKQSDLWGINLYPDKFGTQDFIEFDSMINIRPRQNNMSRGIEDEAIRSKIIALISKRVKK
jgi:hypothetical protein